MSIDFRSDPIGPRTKGWKTPPRSPRTRLVPGWEPRPEFGAGQGPEDYLSLIPPVELPTPAEPYDWGAIRSAVFPDGLTPAPEPEAPSEPLPTMVPADRADRAAAARAPRGARLTSRRLGETRGQACCLSVRSIQGGRCPRPALACFKPPRARPLPQRALRQRYAPRRGAQAPALRASRSLSARCCPRRRTWRARRVSRGKSW
jgi:hypothetical protein